MVFESAAQQAGDRRPQPVTAPPTSGHDVQARPSTQPHDQHQQAEEGQGQLAHQHMLQILHPSAVTGSSVAASASLLIHQHRNHSPVPPPTPPDVPLASFGVLPMTEVEKRSLLTAAATAADKDDFAQVQADDDSVCAGASEKEVRIMLDGAPIEDEAEQAPGIVGQLVQGSRSMMWVLLFFFTVFNGMTTFCFRLEVLIDGDDALDPGSFMFNLLIGSMLGHSFMVSSQAKHLPKARPSWMMLWAFVAGSLNNIGINGVVLLTTSGGEASLLAPLTSLYIIIPILSGIFCMGDRLSGRRGLGIALGIASTMLFAFADTVDGGGGGSGSINSTALNATDNATFVDDAQLSLTVDEAAGESFSFADGNMLLYFALCFFGWGLATAIFQMMSTQPREQMAATFLANVLGFVITGYVAVFAVHGGFTPGWDIGRGVVIIGAACHAIANAVFVLLSRAMPSEASVVAPLTSLYVLWPIILGVAALGESFGPMKGTGVILAVVAVLLMGVKDVKELLRSCRGGRKAATRTLSKQISEQHVAITVERDVGLDTGDTVTTIVTAPVDEDGAVMHEERVDIIVLDSVANGGESQGAILEAVAGSEL